MSESCPVLVPDSYADAVGRLAEYGGDARVLAGGQSLAVLMRLGMAEPAALISLRRCPDACTGTVADGVARLGARFTVADAATGLGAGFAAVRDAARQVASPHVRAVGSVVGNVCHADPANDMAVPLLCHEAVVVVQSLRGRRSVALGEFLDSPYTPAIADDELVVELRVPQLTGWAGAYRKLVWRSADHPVAGVAAVLRVRDGVIDDARVALGAALGVPALLPAVRQAVLGQPVTGAGELAAAAAAEELHNLPVLGEGEGDLPAGYRRTVAAVVVGDAVDTALRHPDGGPF